MPDSGPDELPGMPPAAHVAKRRAELLERVAAAGFVARGAESDAPDLPDFGSKYRPIRKLGTGGMGTVWEASFESIGKRVAIKTLRRDIRIGDGARQRFLREARTAATVSHPGVVDITDVGVGDDGNPFMVMEYLAGRPLSDLCADGTPWGIDRGLQLLDQLADVLVHCHQQGVVHRDLKPSNILVETDAAGQHRCKIIDFGLAKAHLLDGDGTELTGTGEILGSPGWMSPEQLRGESLDARTDVYSLGCLAHLLLSGRPPFDGDTV